MIVDTDVMRIGRRRMRPDSSTAAMVSSPFALSWLAYSTSRIEFLVTRPISTTMPISLYRSIVPPGRCSNAATHSVATAPVTPRGTSSNTVNACTTFSNHDASTMNTTSRAQLLAASPQVNPRHVARGGPVSGIELYHHVVQLVVTGERADPAAAEEGLERGRDVAHRNPEVLRAVPVEGDAQLRLVDAQVGVHVRETLDGARPRHERVHGLRESRELRMLHHELHRLAEPH